MFRKGLIIFVFLLALAPACFATPPCKLAQGTVDQDNADGLKSLVQDMLNAARSGDQTSLAEHTKAMVLPDLDQWFRQVFGEEIGEAFVVSYDGSLRALPEGLAQVFRDAAHKGTTKILVRSFTESCDTAAWEYEYPVLAARRQSVTLYDVRLSNERLGLTIWPFAYIRGGFRYLGNLKMEKLQQGDLAGALNAGVSDNASKAEGKPRLPNSHIVPGRAIFHPYPRFPEEALGINSPGGTVLVALLLGREGNVLNTLIVKGRCAFAKSAQAAVRRWKFKPCLVNGSPETCVTFVEIDFKRLH